MHLKFGLTRFSDHRPPSPPAAAKAGRMTSPKVFAGETLLGGKGPLHTFFHGGTAGGDVAD